MDLLEHEGLVALLLGRLGIPVDLDDLPLERLTVGGLELDPVRAQHDELVVIDVLDAAGLAQERRNGRRDELLVLAAADDQRALLADADEQPGLIGAHGDERVVPAKLGVRLAYRIHEAVGLVAGDEMGDDLGVGLRCKPRALRDELVLERDVVLDDPVDDDVNPVGVVEVGVRVLLGDPPVRRPPGVSDPGPRFRSLGDGDRSARRTVAGRAHGADVGGAGVHRRPQRAEITDGPHGVDLAVIDHGDARAVVSPVLELLKSSEQQRAGCTRSDIADDSAHRLTDAPGFGASGRTAAAARASGILTGERNPDVSH